MLSLSKHELVKPLFQTRISPFDKLRVRRERE